MFSGCPIDVPTNRSSCRATARFGSRMLARLRADSGQLYQSDNRTGDHREEPGCETIVMAHGLVSFDAANAVLDRYTDGSEPAILCFLFVGQFVLDIAAVLSAMRHDHVSNPYIGQIRLL